MMSYLSAAEIPEGAVPVVIEGADARGWVHGEDLYLRTKVALISPAWTDSMTGPDGVRVYRLAKTPAVLLSDKGRILRARVALP
jgi:intracellular multiplication protein IcmK